MAKQSSKSNRHQKTRFCDLPIATGLLILVVIVSIEFNFTTWNGFWNAPNWVVAYDEFGQRVELFSSWKVASSTFYWHVETADGGYQWDLNFWEN